MLPGVDAFNALESLSGSTSATSGVSGADTFNFGGLNTPDFPFSGSQAGGFSLSNPVHALAAASGVLLLGALLLKAVK